MSNIVYVFSNGVFSRHNNTILFESKEGEKKYIPVENTKEIFVFGEVDFNKRFLEFLSQKEIVLSYFNYYGYYMGSFYPREHNNSGHILMQQVLFYQNTEKRLVLAKKFVFGASENCLKNLKYYSRRGRNLVVKIEIIEKLIEKIKEQDDIIKLMAIEGQIKKNYYNCFNEIINNNEFSFTKRTKRPPLDYINSLISFSNSIIYNLVLSEIYKTHLDPRIGFLHSTNNRGFSLNLDVAEIFKPIIGDRVIFTVLNKNIIDENSFENNNQEIYLNEIGKKKFLEQFEIKVNRAISHSSFKKNHSFKRIISSELYKLEKHFDEKIDYKPFIVNW